MLHRSDRNHLERASATVRTWPKWKQRIIGVVLPEDRKEIIEQEASDDTKTTR